MAWTIKYPRDQLRHVTPEHFLALKRIPQDLAQDSKELFDSTYDLLH